MTLKQATAKPQKNPKKYLLPPALLCTYGSYDPIWHYAPGSSAAWCPKAAAGQVGWAKADTTGHERCLTPKNTI